MNQGMNACACLLSDQTLNHLFQKCFSMIQLTVINKYNCAKARCFRLQCRSATFLGQTLYSLSPISFCFRPTGLPPPFLCLAQPILSYSGFFSYLQNRSILLFCCVKNQGFFFIYVCILGQAIAHCILLEHYYSVVFP